MKKECKRIKYQSEKFAKYILDESKERNKRVFRCSKCDNWHITSTSERAIGIVKDIEIKKPTHAEEIKELKVIIANKDAIIKRFKKRLIRLHKIKVKELEVMKKEFEI